MNLGENIDINNTTDEDYPRLLLPNDLPNELSTNISNSYNGSSYEHVTSRHIDITLSGLLDRFITEPITASSKFNLQEYNIAELIRNIYIENKNTIDSWNQVSNSRNTLVLTYNAPSCIGNTLEYKRHNNNKSSYILSNTNKIKCILTKDSENNSSYIKTMYPTKNIDYILSDIEQRQLDLELNRALNQTDEYRNAIASENIPRILYLQAKASGSEFNTAYSNNNNITKCEFITHDFFKVIASQELGNPRTLNISYAIANECFETPTHYIDNLHWTTEYSAPTFKTYLHAHMYQTLPHKGITTPEIDNRSSAINLALIDLSNHVNACKNVILQQENYIIEEMMNYIPHMHTIGKQPLEYYNQIERDTDNQFEI